MQRFTVLAVADRHAAPNADVLNLCRLDSTAIEIRQADHMAKFMADHADGEHPLAAFGADEVVPGLSFVSERGAVRPENSAALGRDPRSGIYEENAVVVFECIFAIT